jgi:hypothetical protein
MERTSLVESWLEHSTLMVDGLYLKGRGGQISTSHVDSGGVGDLSEGGQVSHHESRTSQNESARPCNQSLTS